MPEDLSLLFGQQLTEGMEKSRLRSIAQLLTRQRHLPKMAGNEAYRHHRFCYECSIHASGIYDDGGYCAKIPNEY